MMPAGDTFAAFGEGQQQQGAGATAPTTTLPLQEAHQQQPQQASLQPAAPSGGVSQPMSLQQELERQLQVGPSASAALAGVPLASTLLPQQQRNQQQNQQLTMLPPGTAYARPQVDIGDIATAPAIGLLSESTAPTGAPLRTLTPAAYSAMAEAGGGGAGGLVEGEVWTGSRWAPVRAGQVWTGSRWAPVEGARVWDGTAFRPLLSMPSRPFAEDLRRGGQREQQVPEVVMGRLFG